MSFPACFWLPLGVVDIFSCYMYVYVSVLEVRYRLLMQIVCVWVELTCNTLDCMCSLCMRLGVWNLSRYHICLIPLPTSQDLRTDCGRPRESVCVGVPLCSLSLFCDPRSSFVVIRFAKCHDRPDPYFPIAHPDRESDQHGGESFLGPPHGEGPCD